MSNNTKEYQTIVRATAKLESAVKHNITPLCGELVSCGLITPDQKSTLRNRNYDVSERAADLVEMITNKVKQDIKNYYTFLTALQGDHTTYQEVLGMLEQPFLDNAPITEQYDSGCWSQQTNSQSATVETLSFDAPKVKQQIVKPLYDLVNGLPGGAPQEVHAALRVFGYSSLHEGQEQTIMNILSGVSTILVQPTGYGKSLCYQLPAYLYAQHHSCITLVVSPLISLMTDQVKNFPSPLKGACLLHSQTLTERKEIMQQVENGDIHVLLLTPEALEHGALWRGRHNVIPPVAFVCIDEVHCLSEMCHNFRSSYYHVHKILREQLGVHCVLGLTATATYETTMAVANRLSIDPQHIIRGNAVVPSNLHISVSRDEKKDEALIELLQSPLFKEFESIIIYCSRQRETEHIAKRLNNCLSPGPVSLDDLFDSDSSDSSASKRRKTRGSIRSYHGSMETEEREKVQQGFMNGSVSIVVATIAFGMGINKPDIQAIIHYNMPKSFESFAQEIGRAGRDGEPAYCHVFINEADDIHELRRFAFESTTEEVTLRKLVHIIFPQCQCQVAGTSTAASTQSFESQMSQCKTNLIPVHIKTLEKLMDIKGDCIATLLCCMEDKRWITINRITMDTCRLTCKSGIKLLFKQSPIVAKAVHMIHEGGDKSLLHPNEITFSVNELASYLNKKPSTIHAELTNLCQEDSSSDRSTDVECRVSVDFTDRIYCIQPIQDISPDMCATICKTLGDMIDEQEKNFVEKLYILHAVLKAESKPTHCDCYNESGSSANIQDMIQRYFGPKGLDRLYLDKHNIRVMPVNAAITHERGQAIKTEMQTAIRYSLEDHVKKGVVTGRTVARLFQGIQSPLFSALDWYRYTFWRHYRDVNFSTLCQYANEILFPKCS